MVYTPGGQSKAQQFNQFYFDAYRTWGVFYSAAYRDLRSYAGDNWTVQEKRMLQQQKRMILELNKIRRVINLYSGYERENRLSTVVHPIDDGSIQTADDFTDLILQTYDKENVNYICSEAFDHHLKTGLAIIGMYMDYTHDKVNGDLKYYWKPFNAMMVDPYFTKRDLSDCDQLSTRDLLSRSQVKALLPFISEKEIDAIPTGIRDNKYQYLGIYRQYNSTYIAKNLLTYDQYWVRKTVSQKYLVNILSGETREIDTKKMNLEALQRLVEQTQHLSIIESNKQTVELNIIVGSVLLYSGPDPTGLDTFPIVPLICYFEPLIDTYELKIQGIVRSISDAQRQYNRRHSQIIDLMESVVSTGWISKNGAVLDPTMLFTAGAGRNIVVHEDASLDDLREIAPPQVPQGFLAYQDIMDKNILEIPGANDEIMGLSSVGDSQVSGRLAEVRASNGLKGNRGLFDNFELALKMLGEKSVEVFQKQYTREKVARIIKRDPSEEFFDGLFFRYGCTIKQAVLTQTQREAYYYQLLQLRSLGVAIPDDEIVAAAPLIDKSKLLESMKRNAQVAQEAQMQEAEDKRIEREFVMSQKEQALALAQERRARVLADIGLARERISEGEQNRAKATLDNVKSISEIQDMDRRRMLDLLKMAHDLQDAEAARAEQLIQRDIQISENLFRPPEEMQPQNQQIQPDMQNQQIPQFEGVPQ